MFSSSNTSINPFLASPPPFIINHTDDDHGIFLHNHNPLLTLPPNFSLIPTDAPFADAMINNNMGDQINNKKPTLKKDRQKIQTAQGLRDRRVRMSIGIAREFFDLQDTLGFDKASKTLEWLLTKSKTSIMELIHSGGDGGGAKGLSSASTSECEVVSKTTEEVVEIDGDPRTNKLRKAVFYTKESREKARERARARTRAKLCTTKMLSPPPSNFAYHDQNFVTSTTKDVFSSIISNNCLPRTHSSFYDMINTNLSTELEVYGKPWEAYNNNQTPN